MLLILNNIDIDPGVILITVIFSISILSCICAGIICFYKKFKDMQMRRQIENEYYNL